jgi:hypothetical protein
VIVAAYTPPVDANDDADLDLLAMADDPMPEVVAVDADTTEACWPQRAARSRASRTGPTSPRSIARTACAAMAAGARSAA